MKFSGFHLHSVISVRDGEVEGRGSSHPIPPHRAARHIPSHPHIRCDSESWRVVMRSPPGCDSGCGIPIRTGIGNDDLAMCDDGLWYVTLRYENLISNELFLRVGPRSDMVGRGRWTALKSVRRRTMKVARTGKVRGGLFIVRELALNWL